MTTTVALVKNIISTSLADGVIESYIAAAHTWLTAVMTGSSLSDSLLSELERWVTAHFIASTQERLAKKEGAGGAFIEYYGDYGTGLNATSYGQMAIMMDSSGVLNTLIEVKKTVSITAL